MGVILPIQVWSTLMGGDCVSVQARGMNLGVILEFCPPKPLMKMNLDSGFLCQNIGFRTDNSYEPTVSENKLQENLPNSFYNASRILMSNVDKDKKTLFTSQL